MEVELSIEERKLLDELHGSPMVKPLQADLMETEDFGDEDRDSYSPVVLPKGKLVAIGGKVKQGAAKITKKSGQVGMNVLRNRENRNSRAKAGGAENANGEEEQNGKKVNRFLGSVHISRTATPNSAPVTDSASPHTTDSIERNSQSLNSTSDPSSAVDEKHRSGGGAERPRREKVLSRLRALDMDVRQPEAAEEVGGGLRMKTEASSGNEKSAVVGEAATVISPTPTKAAAKMEPGVGVKQKLRPRKRIKAGEERLGTGSGSDVGSAVSSPHARRSEERFTPGNSSNISSRQEKHSFEAGAKLKRKSDVEVEDAGGGFGNGRREGLYEGKGELVSRVQSPIPVEESFAMGGTSQKPPTPAIYEAEDTANTGGDNRRSMRAGAGNTEDGRLRLILRKYRREKGRGKEATTGDDVSLSLAYFHDMNKEELISSAEALLRQLAESEARQAKLERDLEEREGRLLEQLRSLSEEIQLLESQQMHRYRNINEVLEENFRSVGVVENRLDDILARHGDGMVGNGGFVRRVLWGVLDVFANVSIFLLQCVVVKPYNLISMAWNAT